MLGEIPSRSNRRHVFRLASIRPNEDFMAELQLDQQGRDELWKLLADTGQGLEPEDLLDAPFRPRRKLRRQTRFSDGSFPVFYSSLDSATAEAEMRHWLPSYSGRPRRSRTLYYHRFSCIFDGTEKDLRPKIADWPDLVHDNDYSFCNRLGAEARRLKIDGLATWSARHDGSNLPVFARRSVSGPKLEALLAMTYDPDFGTVTSITQSATH